MAAPTPAPASAAPREREPKEDPKREPKRSEPAEPKERAAIGREASGESLPLIPFSPNAFDYSNSRRGAVVHQLDCC
jgi:hypothetical protein